jgi:hypothetical protein
MAKFPRGFLQPRKDAALSHVKGHAPHSAHTLSTFLDVAMGRKPQYPVFANARSTTCSILALAIVAEEKAQVTTVQRPNLTQSLAYSSQTNALHEPIHYNGHAKLSQHMRFQAAERPWGYLITQRITTMSKNTKGTSSKIATQASETMRDPHASRMAKSLAASALAQRNTSSQTSAEMEHKAGMVLESGKYSAETKALAASVVAQSNKERSE